MSQEQRPDRVTQRDIYESVSDLRKEMNTNFASKAELRMWVVIGVVGGQGLSAAITSFVTGSSPLSQAAWAYTRVKGLI